MNQEHIKGAVASLNANIKRCLEKFINTLIHILKTVTNKLTFDNFIFYYKKILSNSITILQVTLEFLGVIVTIIPDLSNIKRTCKVAFTFILYSKLIVFFAPFIPISPLLLEISNEIWNYTASMYISSLAACTAIYNTIKDDILEYHQQQETLNILSKDINILQDTVDHQQTEIKELHKSTIPKETFETVNNNAQDEIKTLKSELRIISNENQKLLNQNADLSKTLNISNTVTSLSQAQEYVKLLTNTLFILVQVVNVYNAWFGVSSQGLQTSEINDLKRLIQRLTTQQNIATVQRTAEFRENQSTTANEPSNGLTSEVHRFDEEFE